MAPYSVLSIGSHPNVAFYNWRLHASRNVVLSTVVSTVISDPANQIPVSNPKPTSYSWSSDQFGNNRYTLDNVYKTIEDYISLNLNNNNNNNGSGATENRLGNIDFIFLSATSLQELSTICASLNYILSAQLANHNVPTIIVESTNFVNLEPFVKMSLQLDDQVPIISIMSDFDIREVGHNNYLVFKSKKESELVYVGKSGRENQYSSQEIGLINKIADLFENANIDVYKLNTPLEFLSYQWKFALPKITVEPLSIIFQKPFPAELQQQILAKPLISGLIFEIITVIKTMGCKLFNSYDNEESLMERLSQLYPPVTLSDDASEAPRLYYDFFNQNQLYLDLLLLQPILIADDYQVKTPYLEFLYAVMSQYNTNNFSNSASIFWLRKNEENVRRLKLQQDEIAVQNSIREKEIKQAQAQVMQMKTPPATFTSQPQSQQRMDPDLEDISDMVHSYGIAEKSPQQLQLQQQHTAQSQKNVMNLQPAFPGSSYQGQGQGLGQPQGQQQVPVQGNASPNFAPQQTLPHGLPPQGLPPNQQIFASPHQQSGAPPAQMAPYQQGPPPMHMQQQQQQQQQPGMMMPAPPSQMYPSRRSYHNGAPPPNGAPNLNQNGYGRDDISYMSGRNGSSYNMMGGGMNNNMGMGMNNMSTPNFDTSFGSMNGATPPSSGNRQFKPTSRKSSRKSTAVLTNNMMGQGLGGMSARHSMAPGAMMSGGNGNGNGMGMGMGMPNGPRRGSSQNLQGLQNMPSMTNMQNGMAPPQALKKPGSMQNLSMAGAEFGNNGSSGSGSGDSLPPAKSAVNLVSVPEATPAPTPAYIPQPEGGKDGKDGKKKKRGFLGMGKKKN